MRKTQNTLQKIQQAGGGMGLQPLVGVTRNLQVEKDSLALTKIVHNDKRHTPALRKRFAASDAHRFVTDHHVKLFPTQVQQRFVGAAFGSLPSSLAFHMLNAKDIVQLALAHIASVLVHRCRAAIRNQQPSRANKLADRHCLSYAHGQRLRHDEDPVLARRQLSFFDMAATHKFVLKPKVFNELRPTVSHARKMAVALSPAVQHPFPRVLDIIEQPMDLHGGLGIMDRNAIVQTEAVEEKLSDTVMKLVEKAGKRLRRRRKLPGALVYKTIFRQEVVPDQGSSVAVKQSPPDRPYCAFLQ